MRGEASPTLGRAGPLCQSSGVRGRVRLVGVVIAVASLTACAPANDSGGGVVALVTHSSPGGSSDVFLREMVPHLTRVMGGTFVVENISGGGGAKAMATIAKAKPNGLFFNATTPTFILTSHPAAR